MAKKDKLTIQKLKFDLEVADKDAYKHFANRISAMCRRLLPERLDAVLHRYDIPDGQLVIQKMHLHVGEIPPHSFEKTIVDRIAKEFNTFLKKNIVRLEQELKQAKFKEHPSERLFIKEDGFTFESAIRIEKSIVVEEQKKVAQQQYLPIDLHKAINLQGGESVLAASYLKKVAEVKTPINIPIPEEIDLSERNTSQLKKLTISDVSEPISRSKEESMESRSDEASQVLSPLTPSIKTYTKKEIETIEILSKLPEMTPQRQLKAIQSIEALPTDLPPKSITPLEKAFIYYILYGRLPSNVKYELGMSMSDIFDINQKDIRFFDDIRKRIRGNDKAKERLIRLSNEANQESLVKKQIISYEDTKDFDMKTPRAFADYFIALALGMDLSSFTPLMRRYNLNDMIRFFYADHPQKLKNLVTFLLVDYPSEQDRSDRLKALFDQIGKSSIVKILASFVKRAGLINKFLNQLNKANNRDLKAAHSSVLMAFLDKKDPIDQLERDKFDISEEVEIRPRIFLSPADTFQIKDYSKVDLIDYYLTYGSLPYSSSNISISGDKIDLLIQTLTANEIHELKYFREQRYKSNMRYEVLGALSYGAITHILKAIQPDAASELSTRYEYFKYHLKSGVPLKFQNAFYLHYALNQPPKSYLEEMINFWKAQFGDDDKIIQRRWKVSDDLDKQLRQLFHIKEEPLVDQIKVDYEFQSYSQDISVKNAGLVILWPFLKIYFNMLELLNEKGDFRSIKERERACHLLQYLAIKQSYGDELYYPLNKILTGYPLDQPLSYEITMTQKEIDVSQALLKNVLKQWNALKGSSVDGLRGSFLIRNGILVPSPNGWLLTVEKKAYDILMDRLPWGIGMIKLSWAPYILSVEWERNIM